MKILFVNNYYPFGSTGKIVKSLEECNSKFGYETIVVFGHGQKSDRNHYKVASLIYSKYQALRRRITGIMYGGCLISTHKVIKIIKKEKPDIVHLHCLNSNFINIYHILSWLKKNNANTVVTNHAEFLYTANCGHAFDCEKYQFGCGNCPRLKKETKSWFVDGTHKSWMCMKRALEGFNTLKITNVSPWLTERASSSMLLKEFDHYTVLNGVDTNIFHYRLGALHTDEKVIFHATAHFSDDYNDLKGGAFLIELARKFEGQQVKFVVAGNHSLNNPIPSNMILLGNIIDQNRLAKYYSCADLVVLTSKKETFSMITAESLCCGTPVVGFKAGAPEMIAISEYSDFVNFGDIESLYQATVKWLSSSFDKVAISEIAQKKYSKEKMAADYYEVYNKCLEK